MQNLESLPDDALLQLKQDRELQWQKRHSSADIAAMSMMMNATVADAIIDVMGRAGYCLARFFRMTDKAWQHPLLEPLDARMSLARITLAELQKINEILRKRSVIV